MTEKARLINELDAARVELFQVVDALDPDIEIYPGWTRRDMLTHIVGWEVRVWEIFRDFLAGKPLKDAQPSMKDVDAANAVFVAEGQSVPFETARLECEILRFAIKTLLADIPADEFVTREIQFPWGVETFASWTQGAINHERSHTADMRKIAEH